MLKQIDVGSGACLAESIIEGLCHDAIHAERPKQVCALLSRSQVVAALTFAQHHIRMRKEGQRDGQPALGAR
jgi:hypothetical protein